MLELLRKLILWIAFLIFDLNYEIIGLHTEKGNECWKLYNRLETLGHWLFSIGYNGSDTEYQDAVNMEFGEDLSHYSERQRFIIEMT